MMKLHRMLWWFPVAVGLIWLAGPSASDACANTGSCRELVCTPLACCTVNPDTGEICDSHWMDDEGGPGGD